MLCLLVVLFPFLIRYWLKKLLTSGLDSLCTFSGLGLFSADVVIFASSSAAWITCSEEVFFLLSWEQGFLLYHQRQSEVKFLCLRDQSGTNFPVCADPIYCQTVRFRLRCVWHRSALGMILFAPVFPLKRERQGQERIAAPLLKFTLGELSWHSCTAIHAEHALTQVSRQRCSLLWLTLLL